MRHIGLFFFSFGLLQVADAFPQIAPLPSETRRTPTASAASNERNLETRMRDMRTLEGRLRVQGMLDSEGGSAPKIDKRTRERIMQMRKVHPADVQQYSGFLSAKKTGIFRLFPDFDCVTKNVIRVDGDCVNFVAESNGFAFRYGGYAYDIFNEIAFDKSRLVSRGFFSQGILGSLGDFPIEKVDLTHQGLKYLIAFAPDTDPDSAGKNARTLVTGIESGGYKYASHAGATADTTYVIRHIAYRLGNDLGPPSKETSFINLKFLSLTVDKRVDAITIFRIVRVDEDGGITIVWKELDRKEAPKIRFPKGRVLADFNPDRPESL